MLSKFCGPAAALCVCLILNIDLAVAQPAPANRSAGDLLDSGARLFPDTTAALIQIPNVGQLVDEVLNHPLRARIEELDQVKKFLNGPQMKQLRIGLAYLETQIGEEWLPALKSLTGQGAFIGLDPKTEGVGVAFRAIDEPLLKNTAGVVIGFIKNNGEQQVEIEDYRGGKFAQIGDSFVARFHDWFFISNRKAMARQMADNLLDRRPGLTANAAFQASRELKVGDHDIWAFVNLQAIRQGKFADDLFQGETDEPGAELVFGGVLEALKSANTATGTLNLDADAASLSLQLPFKSADFNPSRQFFFGPNGRGRAPRPLEMPNLVGQLVTYRDIGSWWLSKEDLYPENVIAQLAQSDSELSTVFGGMDFGQEVLGAFEPEIRIVVKRQEFSDDMTPDIQLPAFALVGKIKNPDAERRFRIAFQSLIGFLNINAGQNDYPQFELMTSKENGIRITGGEYLMDREVDKGLMTFNFSPAIAFQGDYIVISSTTQFARELAEATKRQDESQDPSDSNTLMTVDAAAIKGLLVNNRQSLIAQSMVNSGKSHARAEAEIDLILGLMDHLKDGKLNFRVQPDQMSLDLLVSFRND